MFETLKVAVLAALALTTLGVKPVLALAQWVDSICDGDDDDTNRSSRNTNQSKCVNKRYKID